MTELTFAELTALIAVNGLTVNDRYFITDKNWTIIAIATNAYRVVVPIVTEVTKAELDALVAADGLNEGLQYKVTDDGFIALATGSNTFIYTGDTPYKKWVGVLSNSGGFSANKLEGDITNEWLQKDDGFYVLPFPGENINKLYTPILFLFFDNVGNYDGQTILADIADVVIDYVNTPCITVNVIDPSGSGTNYWGIAKIPIEVRLYY